jgi:Glycolipid transfer protein (GLTP)
LSNETQKIRERQLASPLESSTLQSLIKSELATKKHTATEGLLWLTRGLDFTAQALRADINPSGSQELADSFRSAYKSTLAPHHSWMVKPIFSAAMSATPYRKDFYAKMVAGGSDTGKLDDALKVWLEALEQRVQILNKFMATKEAKW